MIVVQDVSKFFGSFQTLKDVSFEIGKGEIVGFLGQNGAGKTTLMRILTSYMPATSGRVSIAGMDVDRNTLAIRKRIGYLPENPPLYSYMTVIDYLKFAARLKDIPKKQLNTRIESVLEECHIKDVRNKTIAALSKGYQQRIGIAQAIINEPELLILDEPTNGLDPIQIIAVRELIKGLETKRTVIISTHILSEIEQIAKRVLIIRNGEIITDKSLTELLSENGGKNLEEVFLKLHVDQKDSNE